MALRWAACSFAETEKQFRRIMSCDQLWMLKAHLTPWIGKYRKSKRHPMQLPATERLGRLAYRWKGGIAGNFPLSMRQSQSISFFRF